MSQVVPFEIEKCVDIIINNIRIKKIKIVIKVIDQEQYRYIHVYGVNGLDLYESNFDLDFSEKFENEYGFPQISGAACKKEQSVDYISLVIGTKFLEKFVKYFE